MCVQWNRETAACRRFAKPCGRCSLCGSELLCGEEGWYLNGRSICEDCFDVFARMELLPYRVLFGMEEGK